LSSKQGKPYRFQFGFGKYYFPVNEKRFFAFLSGIFSGFTRPITGNWFPTNLQAKAEESDRVRLSVPETEAFGNFAQYD
jgi:hypothetical protein